MVTRHMAVSSPTRFAGSAESAIGLVIIGIVAFIIAVRVWLAFVGMAPADGDPTCFLPVARELANGRGWCHPYWTPGELIGGPYNWHGWLYPFALSWADWSEDPTGVIATATMLAVVNVFVLIPALYALRTPILPASCAIASMAAVAFFQVGRPESAATFLLLLGALVAISVRDAILRITLLGVSLGLVAAAQPTVGAGAAVALATFLFATEPSGRDALSRTILAGMLSAATLLIATLLWTPFSLAEWAAGLGKSRAHLANHPEVGLGHFVDYYISFPALPFAVLFLVAFLVISFLLVRRRFVSGASWVFVASSVLVAWVWVLIFALRAPATFYNLIAFSPIILLALRVVASRRVNFLLIVALGFAGLGGLSFTTANQAASLSGVRAQVLQTRVSELPPDCRIAAAPSALMVIDQVIPRSRICALPERCDVYVMLQANTGLHAPPSEFAGMSLVENHFHPRAPRLLGVPIGRTFKDYAFALYVRPGACAGFP